MLCSQKIVLLSRRGRQLQRWRSLCIKTVPADYDYNRSTEDNYCAQPFAGEYADIRRLLDYSFHRHYQDARIVIQDRIIKELSANCSPKHSVMPWVVFTAGAMGAGKGYVIEWMQQNGYFPRDQFVVVDPDRIRMCLPEWNGYLEQGPENAGEMTQKEAACIAEILGYKALREQYNVVFDGSLRDTRWYAMFFQQIRNAFPGIRIMILHIFAEKDQVLQCAIDRARETGRIVPKEKILESMLAVPESVQILSPLADFVCRVRNVLGHDPTVEREFGAPYPPKTIRVNWDLIELLWKDIDTDGDGDLSKTEIDAAIAQGILTRAVVRTLDKDGDGIISRSELQQASMHSATSTRLGVRPLWEEI